MSSLLWWSAQDTLQGTAASHAADHISCVPGSKAVLADEQIGLACDQQCCGESRWLT